MLHGICIALFEYLFSGLGRRKACGGRGGGERGGGGGGGGEGGGGYSARVMLCNVRLDVNSLTDTSDHPPMYPPLFLPYSCIRDSFLSLIGQNDTCHLCVIFCTASPRDTCMSRQFASLSPPPPGPQGLGGELEGAQLVSLREMRWRSGRKQFSTTTGAWLSSCADATHDLESAAPLRCV